MSVPAFAAEPEQDPTVNTIDIFNWYTEFYIKKDNSYTHFNDFTKTTVFNEINGKKTELVVFSNNDLNFYETAENRFITTSDYISLKADTHYNISFSHRSLNTYKYFINVKARVFSNGQINDILIYSDKFFGDKNQLTDFDFILNSSTLGSNFKIKLIIEVNYPVGSNVLRNQFFLQRYIDLTDLDSNAGWFQKIINAIKAVPDKLKLFFQELGNNVKQYFINLKNDILDGLKNLFIPPEGYFDTFKAKWDTWAKDHLGFIYDIGSIFQKYISRFFDFFKIDTYNFILPKAAFTIHGKEFVLWEDKTVDMALILQNKSIAFLYDSYKVIAFAIYCFCLWRYLYDTATEIIEGIKESSS